MDRNETIKFMGLIKGYYPTYLKDATKEQKLTTIDANFSLLKSFDFEDMNIRLEEYVAEGREYCPSVANIMRQYEQIKKNSLENFLWEPKGPRTKKLIRKIQEGDEVLNVLYHYEEYLQQLDEFIKS